VRALPRLAGSSRHNLTPVQAKLKFFQKLNMEITADTTSVIEVTPSAAEEVKSLLGKPENAGKHLRLYVEQGGCSGMQYSLTFDEKRPEDLTSERHGLSVLVDPFSAQYLRGAVVDFSDSLTAGGFKISNPNARQSCGCGKSFTA
jgi:iron-sulfur cluster assembly accessory protein